MSEWRDKTLREQTVKYKVSLFRLRHYSLGKGPTEHEVDKWIAFHCAGWRRSELRKVKQLILVSYERK